MCIHIIRTLTLHMEVVLRLFPLLFIALSLVVVTGCGGGSKCDQLAEVAHQCFDVARNQPISEIAAQCKEDKTKNKNWAVKGVECLAEWENDCDKFVLCTDPERALMERQEKKAKADIKRQENAVKAKAKREAQANDTAFQREKKLRQEDAQKRKEENKIKREAEKEAKAASEE